MNFKSMGIDNPLAAGLVVFAEVFCAAGVITGLLYRLALIPLIINMAVAFFLVHKGKLVGEGNGELAFLYLVVFVILMLTGPGKYALDKFIVRKFK
jgi:putative oxidoreductase